MNFCVYEHWRPDSGTCFYVGKGQTHRRPFGLKGRNRKHKSVQLELEAMGLSVEVRIIRKGMREEDAFALERKRITFWRKKGAQLANLTDGGEGFAGFVRPLGIALSDDAKAKVSAARKGMKFTAEHREKLAAKKRGIKRKPFTAETRRRMRLASLAREEKKRELHGDGVTRWSRIS